MAKLFPLQIVTRQGVKYDHDVEHVRLPGRDGYFGVLADHAAFLAALAPGEIVITPPGGQDPVHLASGAGVAEIRDNQVMVLVETAETPEEIDLRRAEAAAERARARVCGRAGTCDLPRAEAALSRALARLRVARQADLKRVEQ
jgi:F-type H+-transporting ATPase subunit epsilon